MNVSLKALCGFCLVSLKPREGNCTVEYCESRDGAGVNEKVGAQGLQLRSCVTAKCQQTRECSSAPRGTALSGWGTQPKLLKLTVVCQSAVLSQASAAEEHYTRIHLCSVSAVVKSLITSNGAASHVPKL